MSVLSSYITGKYNKGNTFLNHTVFWLLKGDKDFPKLTEKLLLNLIFIF